MKKLLLMLSMFFTNLIYLQEQFTFLESWNYKCWICNSAMVLNIASTSVYILYNGKENKQQIAIY